MTEQFVKANGVRLAYDEFGDRAQPAIVLIMGLGAQMIAWPDALCEGLAANGYWVVRFDNRDIGLSEKIRVRRTPGLLKTMLLSRLNMPVRVPYKLQDMAEDTLGLMDALDIDSAHLVGASMGGMIAQLIAGGRPERVLSLTSMMSTSGRRSLPQPSHEITLQMTKRRPANERGYLRVSMRTWRLIGSPDYPPSDAELRERLLRGFRRSYYPPGSTRQLLALIASGDRVKVLKKIQAPTLVIHGKADKLALVEGGIDTARLVPNAKLELIDGMGHDLPQQLLPRFVELITSHVAAAGASN